jgi:hypothetical protein
VPSATSQLDIVVNLPRTYVNINRMVGDAKWIFLKRVTFFSSFFRLVRNWYVTQILKCIRYLTILRYCYTSLVAAKHPDFCRPSMIGALQCFFLFSNQRGILGLWLLVRTHCLQCALLVIRGWDKYTTIYNCRSFYRSPIKIGCCWHISRSG